MSQKNKKRVSASQSSQVKGAKTQDVEMDSDEDVSLTQPSSTQLQRSLARLTPAQVDRKMAEVVQFILIKDQKKVPIKRADIVKHVVKEYKNIYNEIMKRVSKTFEQVFGLKLVEIDVKHHCYILINKLEHVEDDNLSLGGSPKTGLLLVILGIIFMRGGVVKESLIWSTLKKLRVEPGERHEDFGDVRKLVVDEFVRQKYLEYVRVPHTDPVEFEFRWGLRAENQVSKRKVLEFFSKVQDQDPKIWASQYKEAEQSGATSELK
ncbi:necdin-like 2 [Huso huso]|uniref:Necdin-like 2 n=1 Tax=Huso huso TaxID=61971 RepID=A0ABR0Y3U4_HUSHU|nr:necdin-like 2 [Acipenser ruthenus]XP_058873207.1 necdin-like 2 [Acipenser ruthenus]